MISIRQILFLGIVTCFAANGADNGFIVPRCEIIPLPENQATFRIDGVEKLRWHFGKEYPRPFFYPFNGPSGTSLTRMGHPGAQNHDHHRSVWFAHNKIDGQNFWADGARTQVRQKFWYAYRDGNDEAVMASVLGWYDGENKELMEQDVVAALIPLARGEHALELQMTMRPGAGRKQAELEKTNFGLLAVRVARTLSVHFGGGKLTNSEGLEDEANIFGKAARWMDYSGPVVVGSGKKRKSVIEGITYFDHPDNLRYPTHWHVREDGWMGASFNMHEALTLTQAEPLTLRYLLHAHSGGYNHGNAESINKAFTARRGFKISKSTRKHRQFEVARIGR